VCSKLALDVRRIADLILNVDDESMEGSNLVILPRCNCREAVGKYGWSCEGFLDVQLAIEAYARMRRHTSGVEHLIILENNFSRRGHKLLLKSP
jgi:hypothetical protein